MLLLLLLTARFVLVLRGSPTMTVSPPPEAAASSRRRPRRMPPSAIRHFRRDLSSFLTAVLLVALLCVGDTLAAGTEEAEEMVQRLDAAGSRPGSGHGRTTEPEMAQAELGASNATTTRGRRKLSGAYRTSMGHAICRRNIWWETVVDPANYKFGCREIQVKCFLRVWR